MIYSSKIAELNRKHAEDMNEFSPGMQEYSTSSIWNYVEENFKTACKIVGNCQKLIGTMMVDLERFLGSDFCPTKLKGSKQLLLLVQKGLDKFYKLLGQSNNPDYLDRCHKEFVAALAGPGENNLMLRYNLLPNELFNFIQEEFPDFAEFVSTVSEDCEVSSPGKGKPATLNNCRSPRDHSAKAALKARLRSPSKCIPSSASPSPIKKRPNRKSFVLPVDESDSEDETEQKEEVSFSPTPAAHSPTVEEIPSLTTPTIQVITDLIEQEQISEKTDLLMLYDDMVLGLDGIFAAQWNAKFEPVQKVIDFYKHPQQTALLKSCAKVNKHSMPLTGEPAVSTVLFSKISKFGFECYCCSTIMSCCLNP